MKNIVSEPIASHYMGKGLENIFFYVTQKKQSHTGLDWHEGD